MRGTQMLNTMQLERQFGDDTYDVQYPLTVPANCGATEERVVPLETLPEVQANASAFDQFLKRTFDIGFALAFLVLVLPLMIVLACALQIDSPGSICFTQWRVGRNGRMFRCIKFRTMRMDAEAVLGDLLANCPETRKEWEENHKLREDPRISKFGCIVRKLSLDELPQLINILRGEMSVVGPRPIVQDEIAKYGKFFLDYCAVKPGLTGLWQVSGRNDVSYPERVQLDCLYVREMSFWLDVLIVLRTVTAVSTARGSY